MTDTNPRLGVLLDALATLKTIEQELTAAAEAQLRAHPDGLALTIPERVANTVANRQLIRERLGDDRPVYAAEQLLRAGGAVALGASRHDMAAVVYLTAETASVSERDWQRLLADPGWAAAELSQRWTQDGPDDAKPPSPFETAQRGRHDYDR